MYHVGYFQDVADGDVSRLLTTQALEGPSIVAFTDAEEKRLQGLYVVGDSVSCEVQPKYGILGAAMTMMALYYLFDLNYPRPYSMFLTVLQAVVMNEPPKCETSKGFKTFLKAISSFMTQQPDFDDSAACAPPAVC